MEAMVEEMVEEMAEEEEAPVDERKLEDEEVARKGCLAEVWTVVPPLIPARWGKPKFSLNHRQILTRQISVHTGKFLKDF